MKTVLQSEAGECGLACLAMIASDFGHHIELRELRQRFPVSRKGATLGSLIRNAAELKLTARPLRLDVEEADQLQLPCILHWNLSHFVVLTKVERNWKGKLALKIVDPALGKRKLTGEEFSRSFTGVALELGVATDFVEKKPQKQISIKNLTGVIKGLRRALTQIILLALALEIFAIAAPLFNQYVVDDVIVSGDRDLLKVLVAGSALLIVTQTAVSLARSWLLMRWSISIGLQWSGRVFNHMTRLPVAFFEKRHLGDIVSRFGSLGAIQGTLTSLFVETALDGVMAVLALAMMFIYSPKLSFLVLAGLFSYGVLRAIFYSPLREASLQRMELSAKENSNFLETVRAITPIKLFGREADRVARWQNLKQDVINRDIKTQKLGILFKISNITINSVQGLLLFYVGADLIMENSMTVGMLFAFNSYAATFSSRVFSLINSFVDWRMLNLHISRLSDIVLEPQEEYLESKTEIDMSNPTITLRDVSFRYAEGEPYIFEKVNLHIASGENVALIGPSGSGKSTLCKIILGLLAPTEGEVLINNVPIKKIGMQNYRRFVGTVMQDDVLLAGSIQDNISFFDELPDERMVQHCAELAAIHDEITAMPMSYHTLVGDMGSTLSGGQKQRVLLARALYKKPVVLAMDEATSHLDVANEKKVNDALKTLRLTRIMVAHRPETIKAAERVISVQSGKLISVREGATNEKLATIAGLCKEESDEFVA